MIVSDVGLSRRTVIGAALALGGVPSRAGAAPIGRLLAATYAREGGAGLVPLLAGPGGWTAGHAFGGIVDASFGVRSERTGLRYLVDEQAAGSLGIYAPDLRRLATVSTLGADPCHAALMADGSALAVANYSSGNVALWRLDARSGLPVGEAQRIAHEGSGPDKSRQAGPHAHWVGFAPGGRLLHSVDLGADAIFAHPFDPHTGKVGTSAIAYRAEPGSGPRHLARHPHLPIAYLVAELANTVTVLGAASDGTFAARGRLSTLPVGFAGASAAAHIAVNRAGTRLYVSNRGHDSIAVFAIDAAGELVQIQHVHCGGHWPRLFLLLEQRGEMLVANERSGNVARIGIAPDGRLGIAAPVVRIPGVVFLST